MQALAREAAVATKGALLANDEAAENRAEVNGLRASMRVSSKLLHIAEKDFLTTHKELEHTQIQLLETRRKLMKKTEEVNVWTDRYNQAMIDLHMAQVKLTRSSIGASAKESALMRGYGIVLAEAAGEPVSIQRQPFLCAKGGTAKHNGAQADRAMARHNHQVSRSGSDTSLGTKSCHRRPIEHITLSPFQSGQSNTTHEHSRHSAPAKLNASDKYVVILFTKM
ncbi:hypothetical protein AC1031_008378 [Aphanomyces cochlioides]|nr:hypothetical protein AC1031_008378 [Aphanomyces cochlioides]